MVSSILLCSQAGHFVYLDILINKKKLRIDVEDKKNFGGISKHAVLQILRFVK